MDFIGGRSRQIMLTNEQFEAIADKVTKYPDSFQLLVFFFYMVG